MFLDNLSLELIRNVLIVCTVIILLITAKKLGFLCCEKCMKKESFNQVFSNRDTQKSSFTEFGNHTSLAIRTVGRLDTEIDKIVNDKDLNNDDLLQKVYHHEEPQESQAYTHFSKRNSRNPNYKTASNFLLRR